MNGLSLLVFAYLATVGLSHPLKSAADEEPPKESGRIVEEKGEEAAPPAADEGKLQDFYICNGQVA